MKRVLFITTKYHPGYGIILKDECDLKKIEDAIIKVGFDVACCIEMHTEAIEAFNKFKPEESRIGYVPKELLNDILNKL